MHETRKIFVPAANIYSWFPLLASEKHWRDEFSAKELARAWQLADGFPSSIRSAFVKSGLAAFADIDLLLAFPEFLTPLPPYRGEPSHSDLFALAKSKSGLFSVTIEGKVAEPFGERVGEWRKSESEGRLERLKFLRTMLGGLDEGVCMDKRYQLFHRTVAALIEAKNFCATNALMLVHSLNKKSNSSFRDYLQFCSLFNLNPAVGEICRAGNFDGIELYLGWVNEHGVTDIS
jgi:uncharacterized protein DUF6946